MEAMGVAEKKTMMKHKGVRLTLVVLEAFVALTSIACGVGLAVGAVQFPLAWLAGTVFSDYTIPGLLMDHHRWQYTPGRRNGLHRARRKVSLHVHGISPRFFATQPLAKKVGAKGVANQLTVGARTFRRVSTPLQQRINLIIQAMLLVAILFEILLLLACAVSLAQICSRCAHHAPILLSDQHPHPQDSFG
jgi:hypothetical protein